MKLFLIFCTIMITLGTSCTFSNKTVDDTDQDSTLSGSLNNPDSTVNDTLTNTGVTNPPDASTDPAQPERK